MSVRSRFGLVLALLGAVFACASPALAGPRPGGLNETLYSQRFAVHYNGPATLGGITMQQAGDVAAMFERAHATLVSEWGYPAPLDDGDGRIDVYVGLLGGGALGYADTDAATTASSGFILLDSEAGLIPDTVMHELFHLSQFAVDQYTDAWMLEATAEWAGYKFIGFPGTYGEDGVGNPIPLTFYVGAPDMSLTCAGDHCGLDAYESAGYSRWNFFEYAAERIGTTFVRDMLALGPTHSDALSMLTTSLTAKGHTLLNFFGDWTVANMWGDYTAPGLKGQLPKMHSETFTGLKSGPIPTQRVSVNHLATRYLQFDRGDGESKGPCYAATLSLNVTLPTGLASRPYFYWSNGGKPTPLAISGSTASLTVPWDTCNWQFTGVLSLPNPSVIADAQDFVVNGTLTVDTKTIATASSPPPSKAKGPFISPPTSDVAPAFSVYGPEVIRLSAKAKVLRLVVFSSGPGKLSARLGQTTLTSMKLRTGNNDLRFQLPANAARLATPRSLSLTSLSPDGDVGATTTRRVVITR